MRSIDEHPRSRGPTVATPPSRRRPRVPSVPPIVPKFTPNYPIIPPQNLRAQNLRDSSFYNNPFQEEPILYYPPTRHHLYYGDDNDEDIDINSDDDFVDAPNVPPANNNNNNNNLFDDDDEKPKRGSKNTFLGNVKDVEISATNLLLFFKSSIAPIFNTLNRRQVEKINEENESVKVKFKELLSDEFIIMYQKPQVKSLTKSSNELYTVINNAVNSYVQPRTNGGSLFDRTNRKPIIMHRYYL